MNPLIRINLLDWRAAEREQKRTRFLTLLVAAALASAVMVGVLPTFYYNHLIDTQQMRNDYLQAQIRTADQQVAEIRSLHKTRKNLVNRMRVIEELQQSRSSIVHYFDQLVASLPKGVYLTGLNQKGAKTTVDGVAQSNARVSDYMVNLDDSDWFADPRLIVIKGSESGPARFADFTLTVDGAQPDAAAADNDGTTTTTRTTTGQP